MVPVRRCPCRGTRDASGHQHDARCTICPIPVVGPGGRTAAHFDGSASYLEVTAAGTELDFSGPFTIAAWVYPERDPSFFDPVVARPIGTSNENSFALAIGTGMMPYYFSEGTQFLYGATISTSAWIHLAIIWDGNQTKVISVQLDPPVRNTLPSTPPNYDSHTFLIGADMNSGVIDHVIAGSLSDVMLFDRALDATDIATLATL